MSDEKTQVTGAATVDALGKNTVEVTFLPEGKTVTFEHGKLPYKDHGKKESLLDVALNYGVHLDHACGGNCACTTCHIWVKEEADKLDMAAKFGIVARLHRAHHGHISGARIHHQQMRLVRAQRQPIGMAAHLHRANYAAFADGIDADRVRPEIADIEQAVIGGDNSADRLVADQIAAAHLVVVGLDDGKIVAAKIAHEQLSAIGLQRQLHRRLARVE